MSAACHTTKLLGDALTTGESCFSSSTWASLVAQLVRNLLAMQETWVQSLSQEDPLEKGMQPTPGCLPGEFHGQRSLAGPSPWAHEESDMTEQLTFSLSFYDL